MKKVLRHVNDVMHSSGLVGFGVSFQKFIYCEMYSTIDIGISC